MILTVLWSAHRCEILTTSKMYTSVSLISLLRLIRSKLTCVVLEVLSQWALNSPKHFLYLERLQISFCLNGKLPYMSYRVVFCPFLFLFVMFFLPCHLQKVTYYQVSCFLFFFFFFWAWSTMVETLFFNACIYKTKSILYVTPFDTSWV